MTVGQNFANNLFQYMEETNEICFSRQIWENQKL